MQNQLDTARDLQARPDAPAGGEGSADSSARRAKPSPGRVIQGEFRILGILSIVVGALLLLEEAGYLTGVHNLWPVFPTVVGAGLVTAFFQGRRQDLLLLGIGAYLLVISAVFFVCNYTSWRFLSSAWPLFVALLGLTSVLASFYASRTRRVLWLSGLLLNIVALVLYLILEVNVRLWPISLVLFGAWILIVTRARRNVGGSHA